MKQLSGMWQGGRRLGRARRSQNENLCTTYDLLLYLCENAQFCPEQQRLPMVARAGRVRALELRSSPSRSPGPREKPGWSGQRVAPPKLKGRASRARPVLCLPSLAARKDNAQASSHGSRRSTSTGV